MGENQLESEGQNRQLTGADTALIHQVRDGGSQGVFSQGSSENVRRLLGTVEMANAVSDTPQPAAQEQSNNTRIADGANGSKIALAKFPDGQERPMAVREPDGVVHQYEWKDVGGKITCTKITDVNANNQVEAESTSQDGRNWTVKLSSGQQFNLPGRLDINRWNARVHRSSFRQ